MSNMAKMTEVRESTFRYSIPNLISRKNLPPDVINSLLKILNELSQTEWKTYYRSNVVENFMLIPRCYLQSLKFLNITNSREDQVEVPLIAVQKVIQYLETRVLAKETLTKNDKLIFIEVQKMMKDFKLALNKCPCRNVEENSR